MGYKISLCDCCFDCLLGTFLPCVLYGKTAKKINSGLGGKKCFGNAVCFVVFSTVGLYCIPILTQRTAIRKKYGFEDNSCDDCCNSVFCACCALIQNANEVKFRKHLNSEKTSLLDTPVVGPGGQPIVYVQQPVVSPVVMTQPSYPIYQQQPIIQQQPMMQQPMMQQQQQMQMMQQPMMQQQPLGFEQVIQTPTVTVTNVNTEKAIPPQNEITYEI